MFERREEMKSIFRVLLACVIVVSALFVMPSGVSAATSVYDNDQAGWEAAVGAWLTEDFEDGTVGPGVSVDSDNGYIYTQLSGNKLWYDDLVYEGEPTTFTTWTFDVPIYAFGGMWKLGGPDCGGPGSNIEVLINGSWESVGVIDREYINVFWGFVSDVPFTQVRLQAYNFEGIRERYTLDDMVYAQLKQWVTGGGTFGPYGSYSRVTFGGNVGIDQGGNPIGQFQLTNHDTKVSYHTTEILSVSFPAPNTITFRCTLRNNYSEAVGVTTFTLVDNGQGKKAAGKDQFKEQGLPFIDLKGGNIKVHAGIP